MNVMQRWKYIATQCDIRSVAVLNFGGDGDSHLMKCIKVSSTFNPSPSDPLLAHIPFTALLDSCTCIMPEG